MFARGWIALFLVMGPSLALGQGGFDELFTGTTLRVDLSHVGTARQERYMVRALMDEGPWPGSRTQPLDPTGLGKNQVRLYVDNEMVYSRGYCTLFGEWQTTDEAKAKVWRSFQETLRVPMPRKAARLSIYTRDRRNRFIKIFETRVDPSSYTVIRGPVRKGVKIMDVAINGPVERALDILIIGDGYGAGEEEKFRRDLERFARILLTNEPFAARRRDINIRGAFSPSAESGPDEPRKGLFRDTAVGTSFNTFQSARYLTTDREWTMRDIAGLAPYDTLCLVVNTGRYGGGGIFNLYAVFMSDNEFDDYVFIHEFGHSLAGLGDEYYTSSVAYSDFYLRGVEPWEPNITALLKGRRDLKWRDLLQPTTPIPTPVAYEGQVVGAYEGAGYAAKGLFRPQRDCKMFGKGNRPFCAVCTRSIERIIDLYSR